MNQCPESNILNVIMQLLCYSDGVVTDNPHMRAFDNRLRMESIPCKNPYGNSIQLAPGQSFSLFSTTVASNLAGGNILNMDPVNAQNSVYRMTTATGGPSFRTPRAATSLTSCVVTINNGAVASFNFAGADVSAVQPGDIMRINGQVGYDTGPFAFNPINAGPWKVIGVSGTIVSAVRLVGQAFSAVQETVAGPVNNDVLFYADDMIREGMMFQINGTFSQVTQRTYQVLESTPNFIQFVSTQPIPQEDAVSYTAGTIIFYTGIKKLVYIEVDQECSVRFDGQTDDLNRITPIEPGNRLLKGFMNKMGETYSCTVVNQSVNTCNVKFFTVE